MDGFSQHSAPVEASDEPPATLQKILSWIIALISGLVLLGWITGQRALMSVIDGFPTMKANTAIGFLMISIGLVCPHTRRAVSRLQIAGLLLAILMLATLSQYLTGYSLGVDEWLIADPYSTELPGRPSPATAVTFIILALTMLTAPLPLTGGYRAFILLLSASIPLTVLGVYLLDPADVQSSDFFSTVALHTALLFLLSTAALTLRLYPQHRAADAGASVGRRQFERLLFPVLMGPLALGVVVYNLMVSGELSPGLAMGLYIAAFSVVVLGALIWNSAQESLWYRRIADEEREREATYRKLSSMMDIVRGGIIYLAADGSVRESNRRAAAMFGVEPDEFSAVNISRFVPDEWRERFERVLARMTSDRQLRHYRHRMFRLTLQRKNGQRFTVLCSVGPVAEPSGSVMGVLLVNAESIEQQMRQLKREVRIDHLTSAGTRASLEARLNELESYGSRGDGHVGLIMLDIDHFKAINDRFGHLAGDQILADFARRVDDSLRYTDTLYRYGGEEFVVVVVGATEGSLERLAERIRRKIADQAFHWQDERIAVTCSLGVTCHREGESYVTALERVDTGLYAAKEEGRNCVRLL
ncbi:MAG: hypothetical protein CSH36_07995 [Thalassolituus sp.]|nr:MAG: hypothetical protein CSH36_07995 [Thalassolituus sp.]